ncbi:MAG: helix-turn-helix domain-containing protein, partial [Henriciella sp.]|nr:helix-turn-helix domain-containing protein [Henriciella sp.]
MTYIQNHPFPAFGQRLRRLRRALGMKQLALSHILGVDQATISRWENASQTPDANLQQRALDALSTSRTDDAALRRLVENSADCVHLVEEATHICLAYSPSRARDWCSSRRDLLGVSLWQFANGDMAQLGNLGKL